MNTPVYYGYDKREIREADGSPSGPVVQRTGGPLVVRLSHTDQDFPLKRPFRATNEE